MNPQVGAGRADRGFRVSRTEYPMSAVALGEDLGIETAADLMHKLSPLVVQPEPLMLDAGEVRRVHTAGIQVLCALAQDRRQAGLDTGFSATSDAFLDAVRLLGVATQLGISPTEEKAKALETAA